MTTEAVTPKKKNKGLIRFEAIIPVTIIMAITIGYFSYYFDQHLKFLVEYVGTRANGAEVNVASIRTSFIKGSFDLDGLEVTDIDKPARNLIAIENIHFKYLWDALLRMKFVVEDASINNIQVYKPRSKPGKVLPPEPAKPSKMEEIQKEVMGQVKNKYAGNVLADLLNLAEGDDPETLLKDIQGELKSEARIKEMMANVDTKKKEWDEKIKKLSDTSKIKEIEASIQVVKSEKNVINQLKGIEKLNSSFKDVQNQYKEIQSSSKLLEQEIKTISEYPKEIQGLVKSDIDDLKNRFKIPKLELDDLAMNLFLAEFAGHISKVRKYQALAEEYIPKKKEEGKLIPPPRAEGKNYEFPVTRGYPLFWLKRAAISSTGTKDSFSGDLKGEIVHITTAPKQIALPAELNVKGNFPGQKIMGLSANVTVDHTKSIAKQSISAQIASFELEPKLFVNTERMKFGYDATKASTQFKAEITDGIIEAQWNSSLNHPQFKVEAQSKIAKEVLTNILTGIDAVTIDGQVKGPFKNLAFSIKSNLGDILAEGFKKELNAKIAEAQTKIQNLIDQKIKQPQAQLMSQLGGNGNYLNQLKNIDQVFQKNQNQIKAEIDKLTKGGNKTDDLKEKGKKILKGLKF